MTSRVKAMLEALRDFVRFERKEPAHLSSVIVEVRVTKEQLRDEAEQLAQNMIGVSADQAYAELDAGKYENTAFAARMNSIKWLLNEPHDDHASPLAAE